LDKGGRVLSIVLAINRVLEADRDPWGAADWWQGQNLILGGIPADLIPSLSEEALDAAARAAVA
jgi:hypothetical protein